MTKNRCFLSKFALLALLMIITSLSSAFAANAYYVVVNKKMGISKISKGDLKELYLGKKKFWGKNIRVNVSFVNHNSPVTKRFIDEVVNKTPDQFQRYWRRKLFTGSGLPPKKFSSDDDLLKYVGKTIGAIGIISSDKYHKNGIRYLTIL